MTVFDSSRLVTLAAVLTIPLCVGPLLGSCLRKPDPDESASAASAKVPDELLEDASVEVPHCTRAGDKVRVEYKRMKSARAGADFGIPLSVCLNGLEGKTRNQIASVQVFVDLRFTSDINVLVERLAKQSALVFRRQTVKTFVVNPKGEQGVLEYSLNPLVVFNFEKDICKLRVAQIALNINDVKVKDLPIGPKWLPRGVADGLGALGFNMARFIDEQGVTAKMLVPSANHWLEQNLATLGCDAAQTSVFALRWDFAAGTSSGSWFTARKTPPLTLPSPDNGPSAKAGEGAAEGTGR